MRRFTINATLKIISLGCKTKITIKEPTEQFTIQYIYILYDTCSTVCSAWGYIEGSALVLNEVKYQTSSLFKIFFPTQLNICTSCSIILCTFILLYSLLLTIYSFIFTGYCSFFGQIRTTCVPSWPDIIPYLGVILNVSFWWHVHM